MEPMDQEELRRQAQRAMQRRIGSAAEHEEPERPPAKQEAPPPSRRKSLAERLQDLERSLNEQYERPREMTVPERPRRMDVPEREDDPRPEVERPREELYPEREAPERRARVPRPREELYPVDELEEERARRRPQSAEPDIHSGVHTGVHAGVHSPSSRRNYQRSKIIQELHDPAARRRAILYAEILGPPIALRNLGENDPY